MRNERGKDATRKTRHNLTIQGVKSRKLKVSDLDVFHGARED